MGDLFRTREFRKKRFLEFSVVCDMLFVLFDIWFVEFIFDVIYTAMKWYDG